MTTLTVEYRQDPDTNGWTATMPDEPAIVTQGKTLKEAHQRVRAALGLVRDDANEVTLRGRTVWGLRKELSSEALQAVKTEGDLRVQALELGAELERVTADAVRVLIFHENQTYRAAGQLLGITHQRVEQIAKQGATEPEAAGENNLTTRAPLDPSANKHNVVKLISRKP
jgi:predicted RNase H-like HicB family nuclease